MTCHVSPVLSESQAAELKRLIDSPSTLRRVRKRAQLISQLATTDVSLRQASKRAGLHPTNARIWVRRFNRSGVTGLADWPRSGPPRIANPRLGSLRSRKSRAKPPLEPARLLNPMPDGLSENEAAELQRLIDSPSTRGRVRRRAVLICNVAGGMKLCEASELHPRTSRLWLHRFIDLGVAGLIDRRLDQPPGVVRQPKS